MSIALWRIVALASLVGAAAACDSMEVVGTSPTSLAGAAVVNRGSFVQPDLVAIHPAFLVPTRIAQPVCPTFPPFAASFVLLVRADPRVDTSLDLIKMTFVDRSGIRAPELSLPSASLANRFGSLSIAAGGTRRFPLVATFGCGTGPVGNLQIVVFTRTRDGRISSGGVTVPVN
jgi:hypothetical protein